MHVPYSLLQIIGVPLAFVPVVYAVGWKFGRHAGWIVAVPLAYALTLILLAMSKGGMYEEYAWAPAAGLKLGLLIDGISAPVLFTIALVCALMAIYSVEYMEHRIRELYERPSNPAHSIYYVLYLLYAVGMMGTALATNLIQFYLFYELMLLPSWALIYLYGYKERARIALLYFLWTHSGAMLLLIGIFLIFAYLGSFEIASIGQLSTHPIAIWVATLILIGLFVKIAAFGLHVWLPPAHAEAPTSISALLSPIMIGIASYAAVRLIVLPLFDIFREMSVLIALWGLLTMIYGGLLALAQDDLKRFLAYSSISQMGYLITGIASITAIGIAGAIFHYLSHGLGKCILFAVSGILICQVHGIRSIKKLGGLAPKMPLTAIAFILGFFIIAGVPPLVGFQSKLLIFVGAIEGGLEWGLAKLSLAILALFATLITVAYALWTIWRVFFGPLPRSLEDAKDAPPTMTVPLFLLLLVAFALGIYPRLITDPLVSCFHLF